MAEKHLTERKMQLFQGYDSEKFNNKAIITGIVVDNFEYDYEWFSETFYRTKVLAKRISKNEDLVPVIVSDAIIGEIINTPIKDKWVEVKGEFRSYNWYDADGNRHTNYFLFAKEFILYEEKKEWLDVNENMVYLDGFICKKPCYRKTPLGSQITEIIIAVNYPNRKPDYIPCIIWNKAAKWANYLIPGDRVKLFGRIQSRVYLKRDTGEHRTAYEVSVWKIGQIEVEAK